MTRRIVAFAGRQGSGKNYRCDQLVKQGNFKSMAFADALRDIAFSALSINKELGKQHYEDLKAIDCIDVRVQDKNQEHLYQHIQMNFRKFLEYLGTEGIRRYDKDFWARALVNTIDTIPEDINICVSDLRFHNEYKYLKEYADKNGCIFEFIFCDYHSDRYQAHNPHASARLAEFLKEVGYEDGDIIKEEDMQHYIEALEEVNAL